MLRTASRPLSRIASVTSSLASRSARPNTLTQKRNMTVVPGSVLKSWYNMVGKNNITYMAFLAVGIVVSEGVFGTVTDGIWSAANQGKLYDSVDWSRFEEEEEEEEEEEDEE